MSPINSFVKGSTQVICILGYPIKHSLSPQIHNYIIQKLGLNYVYIPVTVPPQSLHSMLFTLKNCGFAGANVTIPHKEHVVNYCDRISELSKKTGTVNTLYVKDNQLCGTTTDYEGFKRAIGLMHFDLRGSKVVILGNGGTARTIATALSLENEISSLTIAGRNSSKASALANTVSKASGQSIVSCSFSDLIFQEVMHECTLLVNTTSAGMTPNITDTPINASFFNKRMNVFDAIYNPAKSRFLTEAETAGCKIQNGLPMLLYQALASFKIWTGVDVQENIVSLDELQMLIGSE